MNSLKKKNFLKNIASVILITLFILATVLPGCSIISGLIKKPVATESTVTQSTESGTTSEQTTSVSETTSAQTSGTVQQPQETTAQDNSKEIEASFNSIVADAGTDTIKIFQFIDANIGNANPETATLMVAKVIEINEAQKFAFTDKFTQDIQATIGQILNNGEVDMEKLKATTNPKLKALIEETINKKYKIFAVEGFYEPVVDYAAYDVYRKYLTQEMNNFIDIRLDESTQPAVLDAGIVIPIDDFIGRIAKSLKYLDNYPDSPRFAEVQHFNNGRIIVYLSGIDNNPVFDVNNKIYPEKLQEFKANADKYAGTEFGNILKAYLDLLTQENNIRTSKIDDFLQKFNN